MRKIKLVLLTALLAVNICTLSTMTSFAAKAKKNQTEKVSALVITDTEEVEFDEPEIDQAIDAAEAHGNPVENEKKAEEEKKALQEKSNKDIGPGIAQNRKSGRGS